MPRPSAALAAAIETTIAGTFTAALTAAVAYSSLIITVFRGFRHFGIIGGVGILLCWISGYVVLPAALSVARRFIHPRRRAPDDAGSRGCCRAGSRSWPIVALAVTAVAGVITVRFLTNDPFESNFRNLRSRSDDIAHAQRWMTTIDQSFGQGLDAGFVIAAPRREDVPVLEARLRAVDRGKPDAQKLFARLVSIDDVLPADQAKKLAVLGDIRQLLSSKDIDALDDEARADAQALRAAGRPARARARGRARSRRVAVHRVRRVARQAAPRDRRQGLRGLGYPRHDAVRGQRARARLAARRASRRRVVRVRRRDRRRADRRPAGDARRRRSARSSSCCS